MTEVAGEATVTLAPGRELRRQVVVAASLLLVLVAVVAALFIVQGVGAQIDDVQRTYETRKQAGDLIQALTDAETGQRGYLLTQDEAYLDPYRDAVTTMDETYRRLAELVADKQVQKLRISSVSELIEHKRSDMATTISMAREGRLAEALSILRSDAGRSQMEGIRSALRGFIADEDASLQERNAGVAALRGWLVAMILIALAGAVLLTYALLTRTQRTVSRLTRSASELQSQKLELERRVRERTAELEEARTHAERERARVEALLQDTNHRVGNSLATVSSLLGLQVTRTNSEEVRRALEVAQDRVQAIASAHRRLRLGDDLETTRLDEFIEATTEDLRTTHLTGRKVTLKIDADPLTVHARDATTIGIVVGELVINAIKHAFPDDGAGVIELSVKRSNEGGIELVVADDGRGYLADGGEAQGLGGLIIRQLVRQYGGEPRYASSPAGGTRVVVPMPQLAIDPAVGE